MLRHDCEVLFFFLSLSFTVTDWSCLMVKFYEVAYVRQENIRDLLIVPPISPVSGASFLFLTDQLVSLTHSFSLP